MRFLNLNRAKFTNRTDKVKSNNGIFNPKDSTANTLNGNDWIIGQTQVSSDLGVGLSVDIAPEDLDSTIISAEFMGRTSINIDGIKNKGIINTGNGADKIVGIAKTNLSATANTVSQAIALVETVDTAAITNVFASIELNTTTDGIDNSGGEIHTGHDSDYIYGFADGFISAIATAYADASAIVNTDMPENLTAFAEAIAISLAQADIIARGINNTKGKITTGSGHDTIIAKAISDTATVANADASAFASANDENQALAQTIFNAIAQVDDIAIAMDNTKGLINTGTGDDKIKAIAEADNTAIAIDNTKGRIFTGKGDDTIIANATGSESFGIFGGYIDMGDGDDSLEASSFGGGVNIKMGKGNDVVSGFGNAKVDGGKGFDIFNFGAYNIQDFSISSLGTNDNRVIFELDGITMITTGFEQFNFANSTLTLNLDPFLGF
ncbi:hypothetical protein WJM97_04835 [Okeanomitos corallinicola TIOX110]|uniref:Uncharacterized protein n=1 Tax=Okeanomitos corallinicola TIOX110 TaxID=3133117 RepID=A0ABZ2V011_9CYAN